ncbi:MAG: phosphodiester glycosidase family protein [Calditrichaeota bacterium]|nr:phosphodiester glycosidase family protein [Calditrichota bacterium]
MNRRKDAVFLSHSVKGESVKRIVGFWVIVCLAIGGWLAGVRGQEVRTRTIVPGVTFSAIQDTTVPRRIFVLKIDLTRPELQLHTVKAKNRLLGLATVSAMVHSFKRENVLAAINADFFNKTGCPVNLQVQRGEPLTDPISYPVFGFTTSGKPFIRRLSFRGELLAPKGTFPIGGINRQWHPDELVYFNAFFGDSVLANPWGVTVLLHPVGNWKNGRRVFQVNRLVHVRRVALHPGQAVLVGHRKARLWLEKNLHPGQRVTIQFRFPPLKEGIREATGGLPQILKNGRYLEKFKKKGFTGKRHPRTAVGISRDGKTLFWMVVDGRQPGYSLGMTLRELADFLKSLGAYNAVNLDGGGSSTMVVRGHVVNHPSDAAGERPVSNAWMLFREKTARPQRPE